MSNTYRHSPYDTAVLPEWAYLSTEPPLLPVISSMSSTVIRNGRRVLSPDRAVAPPSPSSLSSRRMSSASSLNGSSPSTIRYPSSSHETSVCSTVDEECASAWCASLPSTEEDAQGGEEYVVFVSFTLREGVFTAPAPVIRGSYVFVEGDRGVDLGCCTACMPRHHLAHIRSDRNFPRVLEVAAPSATEVSDRLVQLHATERECLHRIEQLRESVGQVADVARAIEIVGVEMQFDAQKLTIYYHSLHPVIFNSLARYLHRLYGCRVWIHNIAVEDIPTVDSCLGRSPRRLKRNSVPELVTPTALGELPTTLLPPLRVTSLSSLVKELKALSQPSSVMPRKRRAPPSPLHG